MSTTAKIHAPIVSTSVNDDIDNQSDDNNVATDLELQAHSVKQPTTQTVNKTAICVQTLSNELIYTRIMILFVTIFMLILCISYSIGQVSSIQLSNYWCKPKTLEEIRQHSKDNNLQHGQDLACWSVGFEVDSTHLWSNTSYSQKMIISPLSIVKCLCFSILSLLYVCVIIYYLWTLIKDINNIINGTYHKKKGKQKKSLANASICDSYLILKLTKNIFLWYKKTFQVDTGFWCLLVILREFMEIFIQSQALLLYNGTSSLLINDSDVHLANEPKFIKLFAVFLSLNSITCGVLWLLYAFKHSFCHGILFELILSTTDSIYDIFYALFPLIVVLNDKNASVLVALGSLQTDSFLSFLATFIPMVLLLKKCWTLLKKSKQAMYNQFLSRLNTRSITNAIQMTSNSAIITSKPVLIMSQVSWITSTRKINIKLKVKDYIQHPIAKQVYMTLLSILFSLYGIIVLIMVNSHFDFAISYCNKAVVYRTNFDVNSSSDPIMQNVLNKHPELLFWKDCFYKVYPFDTVCDCRNFQKDVHLYWWQTPSYYKNNFNVSLDEIPLYVFKNWRMLEKFKWDFLNEIYATDNELIDKNPKPLNLTKDAFIATHLRIFHIEHQKVGYIDDAISNWKQLEYFTLTQSFYPILP
eukprot:324679_1